MKIIWNGHSCFTVETTDGTLVLDPYADGSVPGFGPLRLKADRVLCSHGHSDHGAVSCVTLSGRPCTIEVGEIHTWHDNVQGKKRGANTVYVMSAEGMKIAHLGDFRNFARQKSRLFRGITNLNDFISRFIHGVAFVPP